MFYIYIKSNIISFFIYSILTLRPFPMCNTLDSFAIITGTTDKVLLAPSKLAVQLIAQEEPAEERPEI